MDILGIIIAAVVVGAVGIFIGIFLGIAGIKFKVQVDEKEEAVLAVLPGNNCGGCGFPGCGGLAAAIAKGEAPVNACPVGGEAVGTKIAEIMGVAAGEKEREVAYVFCQGNCEKTHNDYEYTGAQDCRMITFVPNGGPKSCNYGCTGYGNCVKACPFDAIEIQNGIAVVQKEKCKACGKCIEACPKNLIKFMPYNAKQAVSCCSGDKGPDVMKACTVGCIACGICVKNCPSEAIQLDNLHAVIDYSKCTSCGVCVEKCPKKSILRV